MSVMKKHRFHFIFAACFGAGVTLLYLLPIGLQILQKTTDYINIVPVVLTALSQGYGVHQPFTKWVLFALMFFQWFAIGFVVSLLFRRWRCNDDAA
jgi:hypothetical protein